MEYVFGTYGCFDVVKIKSNTPADFFGYQRLKTSYSNQTVTDIFRVVRKIKIDVDESGNYYEWYEIDNHSRVIDFSKSIANAESKIRADIDYLSMMVGVELIEEGEENA